MPATLLLLTLALGEPAPALSWTPLPEEESLRFQGSQQGARFEGRFRRFDAMIRFDAGNLAGSRFEVEVDLASADTRSAERDEVLHGPAFFDVARHPTARFIAADIRHQDGDRYLAAAALTLRERTVAFAFPFRFVEDGPGRARILAEVELDRLAFGLGDDPDWRDESVVGRQVRVLVDLPLERRASAAADTNHDAGDRP